jgi:hypothetical protein
MLNTGVQQAFQDFADHFSHSLTIPEEMTIHKNIFISYKAGLAKTPGLINKKQSKFFFASFGFLVFCRYLSGFD